MVYYVLFPVYKSTYNKTPVLYINYGYVYPNHRKHMCFFKKDTCSRRKGHVLFHKTTRAFFVCKNTGDKAYTHSKKNVTLHPFPKKESEKMYTFLS